MLGVRPPGARHLSGGLVERDQASRRQQAVMNRRDADVNLSLERERATPEELAQVDGVGDLRRPDDVPGRRLQRVDHAVGAGHEHRPSHDRGRPDGAQARRPYAVESIGDREPLAPPLGERGEIDHVQETVSGGVVEAAVRDDGVGVIVSSGAEGTADLERRPLRGGEGLARVGRTQQVVPVEFPVISLCRIGQKERERDGGSPADGTVRPPVGSGHGLSGASLGRQGSGALKLGTTYR